jgi:hypothetical protein
MTFVSLAEAARRLGIDVKTVHRWLAEAQIPLHSHPGDGRKKGLSDPDLQTLARLHHRHAVSLSASPSVPVCGQMPPLPDALLAVPETLAILQAQVAALHQQVAALTALLQLPVQPPPPAPQPSATKRPPSPTSPVPHARPSVAKPVHVIPRVEYGPNGRYVIICPKEGLLSFEPDTQEWFAWVSKQDAFRFVGKMGHFTAHHEWRVPKGAWRAYRPIRNRTSVLRLAPNHELTIAVLEQAAEALQAHLT